MRTRASLSLLTCCCAVLAGCAAGPPKGPVTAVTTPAVGRPSAPQSAQAAFASEAFTPYAQLGVLTDDGLAPADTYAALNTACMSDAGYGQYADAAPYQGNPAVNGLTSGPPFGWYGYVGTAEATQYGFMAPGLASYFGSNTSPGLPADAQAAANKCFNIVSSFNNAQLATSLAGILTMAEAISNDEVQDPDIKDASKAWSACMARNGYNAPNANTLANQELKTLGLRGPPGPGTGPGLTAAQNEAQIAMAVADADCTQATDLDGIFFAVQASYEQQVVDANQQALNAAVRDYKASYAKELHKLPALLRTASATPPGRVTAPSPAPS